MYTYNPHWRPDPPAAFQPHVSPDKSVDSRGYQGTRVVYLNRTDEGNVLNAESVKSLTMELKKLEDNDMVQLVVLKGKDAGMFSKGIDAQYLKAASADGDHEEFLRAWYRLVHLLATYKKPVVGVLNGLSLGSGVSVGGHSKYVYSTDDAVVAFPQAASGAVPDGGASHFLSRLPDGLGMYLALTGGALRGSELYWAGLTEFHATEELIESDLIEHSGELLSTSRSRFIMEEDEQYTKNLKFLRKRRGATRYQYVAENMTEGVPQEALDEYLKLKGWYNSVVAGRRAEARLRLLGRAGLSRHELGELFDFEMDDTIDGRDALPELLDTMLEDQAALGASTAHYKALAMGLLSDGPDESLCERLEAIKRCFGGDPESDPLLTMETPASRAGKSRDEVLASVADKELPADWERSLEHPVLHYITSVYGESDVVPSVEEIPAVLAAVRAGVVRSWPFAYFDDVALDDLCHEFKVPDRKEIYEIVATSTRIVTSRVLNVPADALLDPQTEAKAASDKAAAIEARRVYSEHGNELTPLVLSAPEMIDHGNAADHVFYHVKGTPADSSYVTPLEMRDQATVAAPEGESFYGSSAGPVVDEAALEQWLKEHDSLEVRTPSGREVRRLRDGDLVQGDGDDGIGFWLESFTSLTKRDVHRADSGGAANDSVEPIEGASAPPSWHAAGGRQRKRDDDSEDLIQKYDKLVKGRGRPGGAGSSGDTSESAEPSSDYLEAVSTDPETLVAAFGLPRTEDTLAVGRMVADATAAQRAAQTATPHPRSVETILKRLRAEDSDWARETIKVLEAASPTSLKVTHKMLVEASTKDLDECLKMEFRVLSRMVGADDFVAGLRCLEEGGSPSWSPERLNEVSDGSVEEFFKPLHRKRELVVDSSRHDAAREKEAALEEWGKRLAHHMESGDGDGALGEMMRRRIFGWK